MKKYILSLLLFTSLTCNVFCMKGEKPTLTDLPYETIFYEIIPQFLTDQNGNPADTKTFFKQLVDYLLTNRIDYNVAKKHNFLLTKEDQKELINFGNMYLSSPVLSAAFLGKKELLHLFYNINKDLITKTSFQMPHSEPKEISMLIVILEGACYMEEKNLYKKRQYECLKYFINPENIDPKTIVKMIDRGYIDRGYNVKNPYRQSPFLNTLVQSNAFSDVKIADILQSLLEIKEVKTYVKEKLDLSWLLFQACQHGTLEVIKVLLDHGADINNVDDDINPLAEILKKIDNEWQKEKRREKKQIIEFFLENKILTSKSINRAIEILNRLNKNTEIKQHTKKVIEKLEKAAETAPKKIEQTKEDQELKKLEKEFLRLKKRAMAVEHYQHWNHKTKLSKQEVELLEKVNKIENRILELKKQLKEEEETEGEDANNDE